MALVLLTAGSLGLVAQRGQPSQGREPRPILMSGTYELDATRGDNVQRAAALATQHLPPGQRDRAYETLLSRLQPPVTLAIDRNGRTVTISSSSGPRASFDADGQTRREAWQDGRNMSTRAEFLGDRLSVSTSGNRNWDYLVTFEPLDFGDGLLVTRRMDSDDLRQPVTVRSYYRRVAPEPRWEVYSPGRGDDRRFGPWTVMIPDGTRMVAVLDTFLSTRTSRSGQRFSMTVQSPGEYQGARIEGAIARITPYGPGRNADMRVDFDTIRLRNGQTSTFDAVLNTVRTPGGVTFRVDASGRDANRNRTEATIQQGAIGAALGAIIGAIAGGGKGAAIGAVVGGAGGAILAQDREEYLELPPGTLVTIIVMSPNDFERGGPPPFEARGMGGAGITIFSEANFRGMNATFRDDAPDLRKVNMNDRVDSFRIPRGEFWEVCVDINYQGRCQVFSGDEADLARVGWGGLVSSLRQVRGDVRGQGGNYPPPPMGSRLVLFDDTAFRGLSFVVTEAVPALRALGNRAGSAKVYGGAWELCDSDRFQGRCVTVTESVPDLGRVGLLDKVSSARPIGRGR